jgi:dTDP-4-dehydrorhamnose 3,5-epimerase
MSWRFRELQIPGPVLIEGETFLDERGFFREIYKQSAFTTHGVAGRFVQDNYSRSKSGVLRGLHYQKNPKAQAKLVLVLRGAIFDVAVDLRKGSPFYGRSCHVRLAAEKFEMLFIPIGFAHGFCALSEETEVLYKVTAEYAPDLNRGVLWSDPELDIPWPTKTPTLSADDAGLPKLREADHNFVYRESR